MSDLGSSDNKPGNAIDIFVFSNGEQHAPPRKYHLELKEINMWKGTLRNLGNSHYGIYNADIDIYTTDGRKVEAPSELSHLKAYVAVIPPSAFIQAGYDNYLIKASRSWEKRLLKITNSMESSTKDPKHRVVPKSEINLKIIENDTQKESQIEDHVKEKVCIKAKANIVNTDSIKARKFQECSKVAKCPIGTKQTKKPSFADETTTLKTQIFTPFKISSAARRSVMKAKESLQIKPAAPRKGSQLNAKRNTPRTPCSNSDCSKLARRNIKQSIITSLNVLAKKTEKEFRSSIAPPNSKQTHDFETKSTISNEETNMNKNDETEIISVSELKRDDIFNERFKNTLENEVISISDKSDQNTSTLRVQRISSKMSLNNNENRTHIKCMETHCPMAKDQAAACESSVITCPNCIPRSGPIENFVAIVNNEKTFKIQLNLEIENGTISVKHENDVKETHLMKSILKEEKEIQVNMYEESNVLREHVHAHFPKNDLIKHASEEGKIIIIHCSCLNDIDLNNLFQSHLNHNQMSMCQYEMTPELSSGVGNLEEIRCDCKSQLLRADPEESMPVSDFADAHIVTKVSDQKVITSESQAFVKYNTAEDSEMMRPGEMITNPNPEDNNLDMFISRSTQTNWCSIILQAVCHEDGRYSLHLPPLLAVKNMADCCE